MQGPDRPLDAMAEEAFWVGDVSVPRSGPFFDDTVGPSDTEVMRLVRLARDAEDGGKFGLGAGEPALGRAGDVVDGLGSATAVGFFRPVAVRGLPLAPVNNQPWRLRAYRLLYRQSPRLNKTPHERRLPVKGDVEDDRHVRSKNASIEGADGPSSAQ